MIAQKPHSLTHIEAASAPVVAVTALQMLFEHAQVKQGQRVLIHGAGGNVGALAVMLSLNAGAHVIGTEVRPGIDYVRNLGAHEVIDTTAVPFEEVVAPVDVVIDQVFEFIVPALVDGAMQRA